ncbi:spore germination protein [Halalkalibacter krulwichiae]|uniref:Spore germination protein B1 n=1 Tax=Halalkalibacter krulwichiae TaxID=199441 RepID=A0A1X9ME65_9BACI|nr:spore germination protein [Halalkalibacter krulwichiae]ARK30924.1 Spore germination protein B1 [Halalkalibacter krulwichiae]
MKHRKPRLIKKKKTKQNNEDQFQTPTDQTIAKFKNQKVNPDIQQSIEFLQNLLGDNDDMVMRRFHVFGKHDAVLFYFEYFNNKEDVQDILKSFMYPPLHLEKEKVSKIYLKEVLLNETLFHADAKLIGDISTLLQALMEGNSIVLIDGLNEAFVIGARNVDKRSVDNPDTERAIRGPREGFIEPISSNIALLRYRLQTTDFCINTMKVGRVTNTKVALCYVKGIADPGLVQEVKDRVTSIDIDTIQDSGYIEQFIEDSHLSPFPQIQNTERPDKAVSAMLEGKVVLLVDGSPFALIAPAVFAQFFQTIEDYTERFMMGSLLRLLRVLALSFALFFPSFYVAIIAFNPELIPTDFAIAVASGRAGVPFPTVIEVLFMEIAMEVLREATVRLPQQVGGALSIVGVLVIGQAAVEAGFVNPITVVVIALTTIGSFATPAYNAAIALRMLRFPLVILSGIFGLIGLMFGFILVMNHILSLKSFGVPYLTPIVPGDFQGMKDTIIRMPLWKMPKRPGQFHPKNQDRLGKNEDMEFNQEQSNPLDLQAGYKRWDKTNGVSKKDNGHSNSDYHRK